MRCGAMAIGAAALVLLPVLANAGTHRTAHHHRHTAYPAAVRPGPAVVPFDMERGNAALGGNNANSASGSNSAGENANGRTGGGFGG